MPTYDEIFEKKLELIGKEFRELFPQAAELLQKEARSELKCDQELARTVAQFFPTTFTDIDRKTRGALDAWIEQMDIEREVEDACNC